MLQNGPEAEHIEYLVALKRQTDTLTEKLTALRGLNVFSLQEQQNVREVLTARLIDLQFFPDLQSELMQGITDRLNAALMDLINLAGPLQGKITGTGTAWSGWSPRTQPTSLISLLIQAINTGLIYPASVSSENSGYDT